MVSHVRMSESVASEATKITRLPKLAPVRFSRIITATFFAAGCLLAALNCSQAGNPRIPRYYQSIMSPAATKARVLTFPRDQSLGEIKIASWTSSPTVQRAGAARGTVTVPPLFMTTFVPAHRFYANPSQIKSLPPDGIDALVLSASSLADDEDGLCDRALAVVGHLKSLVDLDLDRSDASDKGLACAASLPNLQRITAAATMVEGRCLEKFIACKHLRSLEFNSSALRDENLKYLKAIPALEYLHASRCNVTDKGVSFLVGCNKLAVLDLSNNPRITDKSIPAILSLKNLQYLIIDGTSFSSQGIMRLKPLPLVRVIVSSVTLRPSEIAAIRRAIPQAQIEARGKATSIDDDTKTILAPLH